MHTANVSFTLVVRADLRGTSGKSGISLWPRHCSGRPCSQLNRESRIRQTRAANLVACRAEAPEATLKRQDDQETDVVVIGSGIGGLCCAALLAKYGLKVRPNDLITDELPEAAMETGTHCKMASCSTPSMRESRVESPMLFCPKS